MTKHHYPEKPIRPLLSICIPTFNRPKEFERMMQGVLPQITTEVELVIRDDSFTLETKEKFDQLTLNSNIAFQYFKGEKIGLDAANLFLIEKASGKFIWWFSDDDEMCQGALKKVLNLINTYPQLTFIWANFSFGEGSGPVVNREEGFFKDRNDVIETLGTSIGLLSTLIFDRDRALSSLEQAKKYVVGFSFAGLVPIFKILSGNGQFYFLRGPFVLCHPTTNEEIKMATTRTGQIRNEGFNVYGVEFYKVVKDFEGAFKKKSIRKLLAINFGALWRGMMVGWIGGWDTPVGKRKTMFKYYWHFPEFWIAMPLFLMPLRLNRYFYRIYKFISAQLRV